MTCFALDFKIFGSGHGMASPFWNGAFYWLNNSLDPRYDSRGRLVKAGDFYTFMHGLGAQLHSYQWTHPNAGERRRLAGYEFHPLHSTRHWGRVEVAWSLSGLPSDINGAHAMINDFKKRLDSGAL